MLGTMKLFWRDLSLSAASAGFVAVLVGFTSSVAIVFQAALALGRHGRTDQLLDVGARPGHGPVLDAAVAVAAQAGDGGLEHAGRGRARHGSGAAASAWPRPWARSWCARALITLCGATGWFERVMDRIPLALASALLAGVLARFGLTPSSRCSAAFALVLRDAAGLPGRAAAAGRATPYLGVLAVGCAIAAGDKASCVWSGVQWTLTSPVFTAPEFTWRATISLALPLFVVTMASQNLPGVAAIRAAGYDMPISRADQLDRRRHAAARAVRCLRTEPGSHHRGHLHGPRSAPRPHTALRGRRGLAARSTA